MAIPEFDITGQKVLIVGGGRGIGKGIALAFAEAGADVAVSALTPTGVNQVAEEVRALGQDALALTGDASKAGVMRFTESVAQEWAPFGVRVNAVAPGSFPDPEQLSEAAYQARNATAAKAVPLGRVGRLKEVGYVCVFLASPAAAYVTGQTWAVDGGVSIQTA